MSNRAELGVAGQNRLKLFKIKKKKRSFTMGDLTRLKVLFVQLQVWYRDMGKTHRGGNVDLRLTIT